MLEKKKFCDIILCITILLSSYITNSHGLQLPASITPCHRHDPKFKECFLRETRKFIPEFVNGLPEYGVPNMDPLYFEADSFSTAGLTAKSTNGEITGYKDCVIEDIKMDFKKQKLTAIAFGNFEIRSNYQMQGRLLVFPINFDGKLHLKIENFRIKLILDWDTQKAADGKKYIHINSHKKDLHFGNVIFNITGFMNKQIDETMNVVLNNNWRDVITEVGGPAIDIVFKKVVDIINTFFSNIPHDVLIPDYNV